MHNGQLSLNQDQVLKLIVEERVLRKIAWIYASQRDHDTAASYRHAAADLVDQISGGREPTSVAGAIALLELGSSLDDDSMIATAAASLKGFRTRQEIKRCQHLDLPEPGRWRPELAPQAIHDETELPPGPMQGRAAAR